MILFYLIICVYIFHLFFKNSFLSLQFIIENDKILTNFRN